MTRASFALAARRALWFSTLTAGVAASAMLGAGFVKASTSHTDVEQEAEIAKLTTCYAHGTDAIGRGDLAAGKAIYAPCFTSNAVSAVYFPGQPLNGPPSFSTTGTDSWADFVSGVFTANGYVSTQHLMGTIDVHVDGNKATMTSYLHATHVLADGTFDVANGTYEDEVVRQNGVWKIKKRTLKLQNFLNVGNLP